MTRTKIQIAKAARLYGLAKAAHADSGGSQTDDEMRVMWASQGCTEAALARLGYDKSQLVTIQDCIRAARDA